MFSFMKSFVGVKGNQLAQDVMAGIVSLDPEAATQAELREMEKALDGVGAVIQKCRADFDKESREAQAAQDRYNQLLAAAEVLQKKLDSGTPGIEASLNKLLTQLEELAPELDREKQDVIDAKALLDAAQAAYHEKAAEVTNARANIDRARRDMERAEVDLARSQERANRAAEVAGLRDSKVNSLNVASDAMKRKADEARQKAEAAKLKADTLTGMANPVGGDANIAAALAEVKGVGAPTGSLAERLAKLKK